MAIGINLSEDQPLSLEQFKKQIAKKENITIVDAVEKESYGDVIPCTSFSLRTALGIGGFAKRKFYTIDGDLSSGKSTTGYDVIANCHKKYGEQCLLIDKEDSYTTEYGKLIGIDNEKLTIITPHTLEDMYDIVIAALQSGLFGVILVDSVTAFAPESRFEGSVVMGVEARVNSDKMRLVNDALQKSSTCLLFIQQTREKIGGYGDPTTVSGGKAIPFYAHGRIRITRSEIDRENEQNKMKFTIIKNKLAPPFKIGTIVYKWGVGFDVASESAELAVELGIISKEKNTYILPEVDVKLVGKKKLLEYLGDNEEYVSAVLQPRITEIIENENIVRLAESEEELF